jgi:hypothetical protein
VDEDSSLIYVGCADSGAVAILWDNELASVPSALPDVPSALHRISPNPFTGATDITFSLPPGRDATLRVYDVRGTLVSTLFEGPAPGAPHTVAWNGTGRDGVPLAPGIYIVRLGNADGGAQRKACKIR